MGNCEFTLLLTACISPQIEEKNTVFQLIRKDVSLRLQDYIKALRYWLDYKDDRIKVILFVENSGYDMSIIKNEVNNNPYNRKVKFIQYPLISIPSGLHYGYAELDMLDRVMKTYSVVNPCEFIVKLTGRLVFPNLTKLLDKIQNTDNFIIDSRDYSFGSEQHYCVTTLFITKLDFYIEYLYNKKRLLTQREPYIEHLFFKILKPLYLNKYSGLLMRFPINVYPKGVGAHKNVNYSSLRHRIKNLFRFIFRYLFPNIWI